MELLNISPFVVVAVAGVTELIKALFDKNYRTAAIIAASAAVGALAGFGVVDGLNVITGVMAGLSASGLVTIANKFGGTKTATPIVANDQTSVTVTNTPTQNN